MSESGIQVYKEGFAEYDAARRAALQQAKNAGSAERTGKSVPGRAVDREELKRLKREQAEQRNALYKAIRPKQEAYARLESELETLLSEQTEVETQLADPEIYADGNRASELLKRFSQVKDQSEAILEKLETLEAEIAELEARRAALSINTSED